MSKPSKFSFPFMLSYSIFSLVVPFHCRRFSFRLRCSSPSSLSPSPFRTLSFSHSVTCVVRSLLYLHGVVFWHGRVHLISSHCLAVANCRSPHVVIFTLSPISVLFFSSFPPSAPLLTASILTHLPAPLRQSPLHHARYTNVPNAEHLCIHLGRLFPNSGGLAVERSLTMAPALARTPSGKTADSPRISGCSGELGER